MSEVRWKMDISHIISAILPSTYQTLLQLMEISQSSDKKNVAQFFLRHRVYAVFMLILDSKLNRNLQTS